MDEVSTQLPSVQIFGLGYIGLPTAAVMADAGFRVHGVDVVVRVVDTINRGQIHISEHGLEDLVKTGVASGRLSASIHPREADVHIVAVPTPIHADKSPDIDYVVSAISLVSSILRKGDLVIIESTIPPRTCADVIAPQIERETGFKSDKDYYLVHCPERVIPGKILQEIVNNDRIIGGLTEEATQYAVGIYNRFVKGKLLQTTATTAEMCKLMENTFRDVNIALANEFAAIAERLDFDVFKAIELANHHPRVNIHTPSIGVGGHCIPVDPWFIVDAAPVESQLIRRARQINDAKPNEISQKILAIINENKIESVALLGLTYKANVDDFRESPAVEIAHILSRSTNATIYIADPFISSFHAQNPSEKNMRSSEYLDAIYNSELVVKLVDHNEYENLIIDKDKKYLDVKNNFVLQTAQSVEL